ncbi:MAG: glycosyltransferase [Bacteroidales bacterium]|nr:glycosyltransferase [Bacteroidales bacterium]
MNIVISSMIDDPFDPPGSGRFGGGHLFLFDLGRYLIRQGITVTYICRKNSPTKNSYERLGDKCTIYRLDVGPQKEILTFEVSSYLKQLKTQFINTIIQLDKVDVIHTSYWISGLVAMEYCQNNGIKHVNTILSLGRLKHKEKKSLSEYERFRDISEITVFNGVDDLIAICQDEKKSLFKLYPELKQNINCHIIANGIDENIFYQRPESSSDFIRRASYRFKQGN